MWNVDGSEAFRVSLVQAKESPAGWQIIVHHIKYFAIHPRLDPRQNNRFRTIIHVAEWNRVRSAQVQKYPERSYAHSASDRLVARTIDKSRPHNHVWNSKLLAVIAHEFVLLHFSKAIGVATELWMTLQWARLIQQPSVGFLDIRIDRKGADADKALHATVPHACFPKIP